MPEDENELLRNFLRLEEWMWEYKCNMSLYIDTKCAIHYQWCIVSSRYLAVDIMISENIPANYEEIWVVARNLPTQKMGNGYFLYAYITGYFISVRHLL